MKAEEITQIAGDLDLRFDATSGGFGATPRRGVVLPFGISVAMFVVFGATPIVWNATRGAASGFWWLGH